MATDPAVVAGIGRAMADAFLAGGVLPVVKHMPGHGRSVLDTHHQLPVVTAGRDELMATDFAPFRALSDLPMAMTAHIVFRASTTARPRKAPVIRPDPRGDRLSVAC
jgi:beta-N-acetylhexosaminidase